MADEKITMEELRWELQQGTSHRKIAKKYGVNMRTIDRKIARLKKQALYEVDKIPAKITKAKGYVVTAAQNETGLHRKGFESLKVYCREHGYELIVIPLRYRNPTQPNEKRGDYWHQELSPYIMSDDVQLCKGLRVMGSIKIQPTAVNPLSGMDSLSGQDWAIYGHTKVAIEPVATRQGETAKLLYTTGAITKANYSDSKAGRKGEFHHVYGALVVQLDGDGFHVRNLSIQANGDFYDLDRKYTPTGSQLSESVASITLGDLHAATVSQEALRAYAAVAQRLKPRRLFLHDVLDFDSQSHHNNFFDQFKRRQSGRDDIRQELEQTCALLDDLADTAEKTYLVASNHNDHFTKWLEDKRNANCVVNALIYAETRAAYLDYLKRGEPEPSPFEIWARKLCRNIKRMVFLRRDEGFMLNGVEHGFHGDKGSGGVRGSTKNLSRIGAKVTKGHDHKVQTIDGCMSAGTFSILDPEYIQGSPSDWMNSMVVQYENGKRTHINIIGGRCGFD
jgi:hypothetical protein